MHVILHFLVSAIIVINSVIFMDLSGAVELPFFHEIFTSYIQVVYVFFWLQFPIVYFVIIQAYINPIQELSREIAAFVTGVREEPSNLKPTAWSEGMNYVTNFFIRSLQILKIFKEELRSGRQLKTEVDLASEVQKSTLEHDATVVPHLEIAYAIKSATEVGGDSCDIIQGINGNHYMYVADATGHGVASGFMMMMVNALISAGVNAEENSAKVLSLTNKIVKPRAKQNMLMSCVLLRWNTNEKKMYFTGAGHEYVLVYKKSENKVYPIKSGGVAIGMIKDCSRILKEQQISFDLGDIIVLYTDGISEARYQSKQDGMLFGVERIIESIMKLEVKSIETIFQQITIDISAFMGYKHTQYDDITLMVMRYTEGEWRISTDEPMRIDSSHITEWNWWKTQAVSHLEK